MFFLVIIEELVGFIVICLLISALYNLLCKVLRENSWFWRLFNSQMKKEPIEQEETRKDKDGSKKKAGR